jgi:hypothetical protein
MPANRYSVRYSNEAVTELADVYLTEEAYREEITQAASRADDLLKSHPHLGTLLPVDLPGETQPAPDDVAYRELFLAPVNFIYLVSDVSQDEGVVLITQIDFDPNRPSRERMERDE